MTIADFLYQAGFWQWLGLIILVALAAHGIANFRLFGNIDSSSHRNSTVFKRDDDK